MNDAELYDARILIVDDEPANTTLLEAFLRRWGFRALTVTNRSQDVLELCETLAPDLLLLDLHMPPPDGLELLRLLEGPIGADVGLPVLVLTADGGGEIKRRALRAGARDFLSKPFDPEEVRLRVSNLLTVRFAQRQQHSHAAVLEHAVWERTRHLEDARLEVVQRLGRAAEYRDDQTGQHTARVARTAGCLARGLGLPAAEVRQIVAAAPLHDVGKIAIPDSILLKPGRLSPAEFAKVKLHVHAGAEILAGSDSPLLQKAEQIALTHHEHWDGGGYPAGLIGEEIPLAGRIVAVADVFDALITRRPYKDAWPIHAAADEIVRGAGTQFDPAVVDVFAALDLDQLTGPLPPQQAAPPRPDTHTSNLPLTPSAAR